MIESIDYHSALGLSDHLTMVINFNCYWTQSNTERKVRLYDKADYNSMKKSLEKMNWEEMLLDKTINQSWNLFEEVLNDLCEKHVPTITKKNKRFKVPLSKEVRD